MSTTLSRRLLRRLALAWMPLAPMLALLACAANGADPDEATSRSGDALTLSPLPHPGLTRVWAVHTTADDTTLTLSYQRTVGAPYTLTITDPGSVVTTLSEGTVAGASGATFTGLLECTPYTYAITGGGVTYASGSIHTTSPGGAACPASQTFAPSHVNAFEGVYHWRNNAPWCTEDDWVSWGRIFPQGAGWGFTGGGNTQPAQVQVGHHSYWNPGAQPLPCEEQIIDAHRSLFSWLFDASQVRRARAATLLANVDGPAGTPSCVAHFSETQNVLFPPTVAEVTARNDYGNGWPLTGLTLDQGIANVGPMATVTQVGGQVQSDLTWYVQNLGSIAGGFAETDDGFWDLRAPNPTYPQDNYDCTGSLSNIVVRLDYDPIMPDTPMNCSASVNCQQFTVTCDAAPDQFELFQNHDGFDYQITNPVQGSASSPTTLTGTLPFGDPIQVCTVAGSLTQCTGSIPTTTVACPSPPPQGGGSSGGPPPSCGVGKPCLLQ